MARDMANVARSVVFLQNYATFKLLPQVFYSTG